MPHIVSDDDICFGGHGCRKYVTVAFVRSHGGDELLVSSHECLREGLGHHVDEVIRLLRYASLVCDEVTTHFFEDLGRPADAIEIRVGTAQQKVSSARWVQNARIQKRRPSYGQ